MNPRALFSELRRRRVFRVAAVYAAAAFVVAQVADIFFPGLGLPEWSLRLVLLLLILGFPLALGLAWAFDLTPEGVVRTDAPPAAPATPAAAVARRRDGGRAAAWLGAGILVGLVAVGAYSGVQTWRGPPAAEGVSLTAVAVLPFSVRGSGENEYLGEGMVDLLSAKLDGAGALRAVDPRALVSFLAREGSTTADPEQGRVVAEHFGAGLFILGGILEAGGRLQLSASLYSGNQGTVPVASARVDGEVERIWELVDRLAAQLLAEQFGGGERLTRLAATTTESFPALRAYLEGESAFRVGNFPAAIDAFQRAVAADSAFALAHYRLAMAAAWAFDPALSGAAIERAVRHGDRLSERDRRLVTAYQMYEQGRAAEAEPIYRSLVASYPDDIEAWYQLGEVLIHHNAFRGRSWHEAREPFARAVALDPGHELSTTHVLLLDFVEGKRTEVAALLDSLDPDGAFHAVHAPFVWLLGDGAGRGQALEALRHTPEPIVAMTAFLAHLGTATHDVAPDVARLLTAPARPAAVRARGYLMLASLELGRGRRQAAMEAVTAANSLDPVAALHLRGHVSLAPVLPTPRSELASLRAALNRSATDATVAQGPGATVEDLMRAQIRSYLLGLSSARLGDADAADRHAAELGRMGRPASTGSAVPDFELAVRAEAALARGDTAKALSLLERARLEVPYGAAVGSPFLFQDRERFVRAELLSRAGRLEEAVGWYTAVTESSAAYAAIAHLRLGEIRDRLGDPYQAAEHYARFVTVWTDCDPELRPLRERAERRLAVLRRGGR